MYSLFSENGILKGVNQSIKQLDCYNNNKWKSGFKFIQMCDTQFGLTEDFKSGKDDKWEIEMAYSKKCIEIINQMNPPPEFVIICGDMINSFPGTENRKNQISDFFTVFRQLHPNIPLICVCGNHDVGNSPTPETLTEYRKDFGDDYMKFWVKGVKFLVVNSQFYYDGSMCEEDAVKHHDWLMKELSNEENKQAKHLIVFQHIPWFIVDADEEDQYFNLKRAIRKKMLDVLISAGVSKVFAGHLHRNAGGWYRNSKNEELEMVITSAVGYQIGQDNHGFRVVTVQETDITHEYHDVILPDE